MFDVNTVFQRTHTRRSEIYEKTCGLTQSEWLVLIMIDGTAQIGEVRNKLPALTDERFSRAMSTLLDKGLVAEVLMPVDGLAPDEVEPGVIDRYLQQDPLDPLTIIIVPDDERFEQGTILTESENKLGENARQPLRADAKVDPAAGITGGVTSPGPETQAPDVQSGTVDEVAIREQVDRPGSPVSARDAVLADEIGVQARARGRLQARVKLPAVEQSPYRRRGRGLGENLPLVYWLAIAVGAFILGYALASLGRG